ncbi:MAG: aldo/keto reductase [Actinobacteria bacterium]|nr:aldo/keto reductase [Actinomycetota bacterium]
MEKRTFGRTGMEITAIGFGSWAIGGSGSAAAWGPQDDEAVGAIRRAVELGMNWVDTAAVYYLNVGRVATVAGVVLSIVTAYIVLGFASIIDYVQLLHGIFLAPLFGTFLLGMFWTRTTGWGGFAGLFTGTTLGVVLYLISLDSSVGASMWRAWWAWCACVAVTVVVSLVTQPKPESELRGIVWGLTPKKEGVEQAWYKKPWVLAVTALLLTLALNIYYF